MSKTDYKGYLLDLDGTVYKGNTVISEAVPFVQALKEQNIPYQYVTNNSALTPVQLANRLQKMGIQAEEKDFFTSSMAAASLIEKIEREKGNTDLSAITVLAIGGDGLHTALKDVGVRTVDRSPASYVVVGIDRQFTYEKMKQATLAIYGGAMFISTNCDRAIPTEEGLVPGNGAITASIACATGKAPLYVGKPEATIIDLALDRMGRKAEEVLLIGDNLETDIAAGERSGVHTLLVYSGFSQKEDVEKSIVKPTHTAMTLREWQR